MSIRTRRRRVASARMSISLFSRVVNLRARGLIFFSLKHSFRILLTSMFPVVFHSRLSWHVGSGWRPRQRIGLDWQDSPRSRPVGPRQPSRVCVSLCLRRGTDVDQPGSGWRELSSPGRAWKNRLCPMHPRAPTAHQSVDVLSLYCEIPLY